MNKTATPNGLGQGFRTVLVAALFLLISSLSAAQNPDPALARLVRPTPGTHPLGTVLAELARQSHLPLSYSSSLVPVTHPCTQPPRPARPLGAVLREVLAAEHLSYGLLNGQLVLWPARVAAPVGVTSVNGWPTHPGASPAAQASEGPAGPPAAPGEAAAKNPAARRQNPASRPAASAAPREAGVSGAARLAMAPDGGPAKAGGHRLGREARPATAPAASPGVPAKGPLTPDPKAPPASVARLYSVRSSKPGGLPPRAVPAGRRRIAKPSATAAAGALPGGNQSRARALPKGQRIRPAGDLVSSPAAARFLPSRPGPLREAVDSLPLLYSTPAPLPASDGVKPVMALSPGPAPTASPAPPAGPATKPFALASLLPPSYLHGEAWVSESLPLNAAVKVGIPRLYLVLGVAAGPAGRQSGEVAWGVGLGTTGRPRGRFTPSLDLLHWFVSGDRETMPSSLAQLRPQVGWQLKPGGRWQLVGGPTLNLATARHRGPQPQRWDFGRDQWLWVNQAEDESWLRLWPGVQVGLRF